MVGNFRMDFHPYEIYTQAYTRKKTCSNNIHIMYDDNTAAQIQRKINRNIL